MVVAFALVGVDVPVGVPLLKRNKMNLYELEELRIEYGVPSSVGQELPASTDVVRYPLEGSVMIFLAMYKYRFRLLLHPWV